MCVEACEFNPSRGLGIACVIDRLVTSSTSCRAVSRERWEAYLDSYLLAIKTHAMVIEQDYIDRDFLDDYTRYYARCFKGYKRKCYRIHFFSAVEKGAYDKDSFTRHIEGFISRRRGNIDLKAHYLGFLVVRPLASSPLGRTCLKYYDEGHGASGRRYRVWQEVRVSFFGRELKVEKCMPFLQQDSVSAACATCSLWSAFSITSSVFGDRHYCPGCITSMAMDHGVSTYRCFPNSGLTLTDMAHAIRRVGLDPVIKEIKREDRHEALDVARLFGVVYAYTEARIPVILVCEICNDKNLLVGWHAVTVNGYHLGENEGPYADVVVGNGEARQEYWKIDKLYVHDDQIGPSAKMELNSDFTFDSQWGVGWKLRVLSYLVPLYGKIRVECDDVFKFVNELWETISIVDYENERFKFQHEMCSWDICLQSGAVFKKWIAEDSNLKEEEKLGHLINSYPKYVWKVCLTYGGLPCVCFVVDATDKGESLVVVDVIVYRDDAVPETVVAAIMREWETLRSDAEIVFPDCNSQDENTTQEEGVEVCRLLEQNPLSCALHKALSRS